MSPLCLLTIIASTLRSIFAPAIGKTALTSSNGPQPVLSSFIDHSNMASLITSRSLLLPLGCFSVQNFNMLWIDKRIHRKMGRNQNGSFLMVSIAVRSDSMDSEVIMFQFFNVCYRNSRLIAEGPTFRGDELTKIGFYKMNLSSELPIE